MGRLVCKIVNGLSYVITVFVLRSCSKNAISLGSRSDFHSNVTCTLQKNI